MNWMEAALLVLGIGAFVASFCLPERNKKEEEQEKTIDPEIIRSLVEKELADAKEKVSEVVDETLEYAVEKTERASERISNEKIMAINEYSDTVLADMNKTHQEIMFLYDMLNDKHKNLKETAQQVDKTAKEAEEKANAAANALAVKEEKKTESKEEETKQKAVPKKSKSGKTVQEKKAAKEKDQHITLDMLESVLPKEQLETIQSKENEQTDFQTLQSQKLPEIKEFSFAEQAPHIERPVKQEEQAANLENTVSMMKEASVQEEETPEDEPVQENNNDRILRLHKEGKSSIDIAKELGLGVGEVKLVINLVKGA